MKQQISRKPTRKRIPQEIFRIASILAGVALNAWAVDVLVLPYGILMGGSTGLGRLMNYFTHLPVSAWVMGFNLLLLISAWIFLGRKYASSIVLGSVTYPIFLQLFSDLNWAQEPVLDEPVLAAISGGAIIGLGLGIILRVGASIGGSDVFPLIVHKKFGWSISTFMYAQDTIILLLQAFNATLSEIVLAILTVFVYSTVTNHVTIMGNGLVQFQICSEKTEEILNELLSLGVGATLLHGKSGYLRNDVEMISSVVTVHYVNRIKRMILRIDPTAFITISMVQEVNGRGFTIEDENKPGEKFHCR